MRDFALHLDPSLTLRVGIDGTYLGTVPKRTRGAGMNAFLVAKPSHHRHEAEGVDLGQYSLEPFNQQDSDDAPTAVCPFGSNSHATMARLP